MQTAQNEQPRLKIVSLRLREDEWEFLCDMCQETNKNISEFMRDSLLSRRQLSLARKRKQERLRQESSAIGNFAASEAQEE